MRFISLLTIAALLACSQSAVFGQSAIAAFMHEEDVFTEDMLHPQQRIFLTEKNINRHVVQRSQVIEKKVQLPSGFSISPNWDLIGGIQSPFEKKWVYLEYIQIGSSFNVWLADETTGSKTLLLNENNSPEIGFSYKPIAWSISPDEIFIEKFRMYSDLDHEGIWKLNIKTHALEKTGIPANYFNTPVISPDGRFFLYAKTNAAVKDIIHGYADEVAVFDIQKNIEVLQSKAASRKSSKIIGWVSEQPIANESNPNTGINAAAVTVNYRLPWNSNGGPNGYYVSRHGTPAPTGPHTPTGARITDFDGIPQHSYPAYDFATNPSADEIVRASASGTVVFAGDCGVGCGYGNLVVIRHDDGLHTYYGHFKTIFVSTGQCVGMGASLGYEGTTGVSSGDHIHIEWRDASRSASLFRGFADIGEPRQGYFYVSNTPELACGGSEDTQAPTTSIAAAGGTTQTGNFTANFTDADNVAINERYYQVLELRGSEFRANRGNGFYNDNFGDQVIHSDYTYGATDWRGTWSETSTGRLRQSSTTATNTGIFTQLSQTNGNTYLYNFAAKLNNTTGSRRFGIHIMASSNNNRERGNSYLIWLSADDKKARIIETANGVLSERASAVIGTNFTSFNDYKATYNTTTGDIRVYINNRFVVSWKDASPLTSGAYISFRTNQADVEFDDLKSYKSRGTSKLITVGGANTNDARVSSTGSTPSCKIKSLVNDPAGNWSAIANLDMILSFTAAAALNINMEQQAVAKDLITFPNPVTNGSFNVIFNNAASGNVTIHLYDLQGKPVQQLMNKGLSEGKHTLLFNTNDYQLKPGVYYGVIQTKILRQQFKLIIQ
jgi:murein DD-endopeptidase MepM/ murein hydrolase activator NlpD